MAGANNTPFQMFSEYNFSSQIFSSPQHNSNEKLIQFPSYDEDSRERIQSVYLIILKTK